ncbi:MAG: S9 family peptidase [Flavobacteriales bacterium]|nr:S9 family peptidase [Flavobacteriales bacterium]
MMRYLLPLGLFAGLLLASCGDADQPAGRSTAAVQPPPVIDMKLFFKNPEKAGFQISPDGSHFSYRAPWKNRMNLFVQRIGDSVATQVTHDTVRDIGGYFWKGDRLVYSRDVNGDENFIVFSASIDGKDAKALTPLSGVRAGTLDRLHNVPGMETKVMLQMNQRNPQVFDPYLCDIATGELKPLYDNSKENFEGWITDHNGVIRMATKTDGTDQVVYYRATDKEPFTEYMRTGFKDSWNPLFFTFDNANLYVSHNLNGRDKTAVVEWDLAGKKETRLIHEEKDYDVSSLDYSDKRKVLTMVTWTGWKEERRILDPQTQALYDKLAPKFEGYDHWIYGENDDETKFMVWAGSDRQPGRYYFYDVTADKLELMAVQRPWIDEDQMAEMKPISYTTRDGLTVHGYLTLPVGREAKDLPVVINPHGGPWARDEWGFNPEVQMLANRGYAVLQMNFRGSTGYGRAFWEKSFKQWGKTMQDDITDGVEWLKDQGIADSTRIAIYGGSYGGYATLAGITYTPDLYACAVDYVGVSNMFTFMNTVPPYWEPFKKMMYEMVGDPKADSLLLREASPVFFVDRIKCPLFIAQGATDPRVNKAESDQVVEALQARGVEVKYMVKDNEGHGFRNEENRFEFYGAMEKFLEQHIGTKPTPVKG